MFEQLIELVRAWQRTLPPDEVRGKIAGACEMITLGGLMCSEGMTSVPQAHGASC
jgi:hypothetical protein